MRAIGILLIFSMGSLPAEAQHNRLSSAYLGAGLGLTVFDPTIGNNPWSFVAAGEIQVGRAPFFWVSQVQGQLFLAGNKLMHLTENDEPIDPMESCWSLLTGIGYRAGERMLLQAAAGPSFLNGRTCFSIQPALGYAIGAAKNWQVQLAYFQVLNRSAQVPGDYSCVQARFSRRIW